jgi:hypothetical protein
VDKRGLSRRGLVGLLLQDHNLRTGCSWTCGSRSPSQPVVGDNNSGGRVLSSPWLLSTDSVKDQANAHDSSEDTGNLASRIP